MTFAFAILPLGHARKVPATALFREQGFEASDFPPGLISSPWRWHTGALAALAIFTSEQQRIATIFLAAMAAGFRAAPVGGCHGHRLARETQPAHPFRSAQARRRQHPPPRRSDARRDPVLGLGLSLLVALALIDGNLRRELTGNLPERAPNFFFVDIQSSEIDGFRTLVEGMAPEGKLIEVPMLRGRIVELNGTDVAKVEVRAGRSLGAPRRSRPDLRGQCAGEQHRHRGRVVAEGYTGEPLVSFAEEEGRELGLKIGDTVTINVLGRNITAKIANFRTVEWESLSMNFVMVFSPNTFAGARMPGWRP